MSAAPASRGPVARRARMLRALGVTPWVRHTPASGGGDLAAGSGLQALDTPPIACVVVLPEGCSARAMDLLGRALAAYGPGLARAGRILVREGRPTAPIPSVRAYLVFGQAQAHALGRELPAAVMNQAQIVLADDLPQVLTSGTGKRRLWIALRQLRRTLAVAGAV